MKQLKKTIYRCMLLFMCFIFFFSCKVVQIANIAEVSIVEIKDSIIKPHSIWFNELKVISNNEGLKKKITFEIQNLSENEYLETNVPKERLEQKMLLYKECKATFSHCRYTPEGYTILSNDEGILNIKYSYNQLSSYDDYYKYACFNLKSGERITAENMFNNPNQLLDIYNNIYIEGYENYLRNYNPKIADVHDSSDYEHYQNEYELFKEHVENRTPFKIEDLNNLELIYGDLGKITHIRFHYNGQGRPYRIYFPPSYEEFTIEVLKPHLTKGFKKQLGLK